MKRLKFYIRNYFGFSQTETNGFVVLALLMFFLLFLPPIYSYFLPPNPINENDKILLDSILQVLENRRLKNDSLTGLKKTAIVQELFPFDPNEIDAEDWLKLGVPKHIATRILNYIKKGGKFRQKNDLQKIYGFPVEIYALLEPYIELPDKATYVKKAYENTKKDFSENSKEGKEDNEQKDFVPYKNTKKAAIEPFEINQADFEQLKQIKGIGDKLSQRIIDFRTKLGGFHSVAQLSEVYALEQAVIDELLKYASLDNSLVQKININTAPIEVLKNHPYIGYKMAGIIANYRKEHKGIKSLDELRKIPAFTSESIDKLSFYLEF